MTEAGLQRKVIRNLTRLLGDDIKIINKSPSRWDKRGISDLLVCFLGQFIAIELKHPGLNAHEHLTEAQIQFGLDVKKAGGWFLVASSWEEVLQFFHKTWSLYFAHRAMQGKGTGYLVNKWCRRRRQSR